MPRYSSIKRRPFTPSDPSVLCRRLTLRQVRALRPIPSGYTTDRVYRLERSERDSASQWTLRETRPPVPLHKSYDTGDAHDWLRSYADAGPPNELHFLGAARGSEVLGLVTWRAVEWNQTLWLVDIRVRERERRSGIGSALVEALRRQADEERARGIFVETQITNFPAVRFYQSHGFQICGFNDHLYTNQDAETQDVALFLFLETPR